MRKPVHESRSDGNNNKEHKIGEKLYIFTTISNFLCYIKSNFNVDVNKRIYKNIFAELAELHRIESSLLSSKKETCYFEILNNKKKLICSVFFYATVKKEIGTILKELKELIVCKEKQHYSSNNQEQNKSEMNIFEHFLNDVENKKWQEPGFDHPIFWTARKKIKFCLKAWREFKNKPELTTNLGKLEEISSKLENQNKSNSKLSLLDYYGEVEIDKSKRLLKDIKDRKDGLQSMKTVEDFLRVFRNMWEHADDNNYPERRSWLGYDERLRKVDCDTFWTNITKPWDGLLLHVYNHYLENIDIIHEL